MGGAAFGFEHGGDVGGGVIAEELAKSFFVVGDAMFFEEGEKVGGSVAREGGFCEVRIGGDKVFGRGVNVGEVAAASTGDENFFADAVGVLDDSDATAAVGGFNSAEEAGGACAEDQSVEGMGQKSLAG
jgi:hypothetical protein